MRRAGVAVVVALVAVGLAGCRHEKAEPGELVSEHDVDLGGVRAHRIRYGSLDVRGGASAVTGLVAVPSGDAPAGGWPIVAFAHPTTGAADECAPSRDPSLGLVGDTLRWLAGEGYLAVATDYEGLGTRGDHPYLNGPSEARAIADSVRAARELVPAAGTRWVVLGHSQGGHAALWSAEVGQSLAPELDLLGAVAEAPAAVPADLVGAPGFLLLAVGGWLASDSDVDEDNALTDAGRDSLEALDDGCNPQPTDPVLRDEATPQFETHLAANAAGRQAATVPVLIGVGSDDALTTPASAGQVAERLCGLGSTVELRTYPATDHLTIVEVAKPDVLAWIADRFAGRPTASTC